MKNNQLNVLLIMILMIACTLIQQLNAQTQPIQATFGTQLEAKAGQTTSLQFTIVSGQQFIQLDILNPNVDFTFNLQRSATGFLPSNVTHIKSRSVHFFRLAIDPTGQVDVPQYNAVFRFRYNSDNALAAYSLSSLAFGVYVPNNNAYMLFDSQDRALDLQTRALTQGATSLVDLAAFTNDIGIFADASGSGGSGGSGNQTSNASTVNSLFCLLVMVLFVIVSLL